MRWKLFERVPEADVERMLAMARTRHFERNEVVFHEGDPADTVHLIESGRVAVRISNHHGQRMTLAVLGPGEPFGELALLGGERRRSATVAALEPVVTRSVYEADFQRLRREHPGLSEVIIALLTEHVHRLSDQLSDALLLPAESRVRKRLLELSERYDTVGGETVVALRQEELADLAGTSRATVNRVLREEAARGSVRLTRGATTVVDRDLLAELIW